MRARRKHSASSKPLRPQANQLLATTAGDVAQMPSETGQKLVHKLQVRQIELKKQIDELCRNQAELEKTRDRYVGFYNFAPAAQLTLSAQGDILEVNFAAEKLLGLARGRLIHQKFMRFIPASALDSFWLFFRQILNSDARQSTELELVNAQAKRLIVRLFAVRGPTGHPRQFLFVLTDRNGQSQTGPALPMSGERLSFALEAIHVGAWELDLVDRTVAHSIEHARIFGYTEGPPGWTYERFLEHVLPDDRVMVDRTFQRALAGQGDWNFDCRICRLDGKVRWIRVAGRHRQEAGAPPRFMAGIVQDITERKHLEEQLRKLSRAVEQSPAAILITDRSGLIEYVNPKFTEITGYTPAEMLGKNPRLLKSGTLPTGKYEWLWKTITEGREWRGLFHNRRKNGELFWEANCISPLRNDGGKITHFIAVKEDISEIVMAQQALSESEARYRLISENVADLICRFDPGSGNLLYASPSVRRLLGYTQPEALAKPASEFLTPASQKRAAELMAVRLPAVQKMRSGTIIYHDELEVRHKDGTVVVAEITSTFMRNEPGEVTIIAILRDVTERNRLQAAARAERERLEHENLRRIELEQERIGRDLHDGLCQTLVGAKLRCGLLEKAFKNQKLLSAAREVMVLEQLLNQTIQQTRDLAKGLNPVHLEANGLVYALEELAKEVEAACRIRCRCRFSLNAAISNRDVVSHLYRITQEAVQNAVRHGKARNISIILREQDGQLILVIKDDGKGFAGDMNKSAGAGLHNIKTRAAMIGGRLTIQSGKRGGGMVRLSLPSPAGQNWR